ncbi:SIMPL domain-containing protein [Nevskia sp.]|uniref:SIMPL domain-containing protein n=1 Tax=Nevskia sp. TaxID=1929292 RepID=UPI0025D49990|nr:SIMPL domain-containing protein [Nevskia sp.]
MRHPLLTTTAASLMLLLGAAPALAHGEAPPDRRSVNVSGRGEVVATPDRARISMQVETTKLDLRAAQTEVSRIVRDYLAQAKALGIAEADISTAGLSIQPEYDYNAKGGRKFLGYHLTRGIEVVVRDLDKIGDVLLKATAAGINNVSDPALESSKAESLTRDALAKAADDARAKAKVLADALGVKLGAVHTLNANAEFTPPPFAQKSRYVAVAAAAPEADTGNEQFGFSAGQIRYSASVNADFDLIAP